MSTHITCAFLSFCVAILIDAMLERNWRRALCLVGAIVISIAVLGMTER